MKKIHKYLFTIGLIGLIFALISSCENSMGIFYALEREVPIQSEEKGLPKNTAVKRVVLFNDGSNNDWVVQGSSTLFRTELKSQADAKTGNFVNIAAPTGMQEVLAIGATGTRLWATYRADSASPGRLFFRDSVRSSNWTELSSAPLSDDVDVGYYPWDILAADATNMLLVLKNSETTPSYRVRTITNLGAISGLHTNLVATEHPRAVVNRLGSWFLFTASGNVYSAGAISATAWGTALAGPSNASRKWLSATLASTGELVAVSWDGRIASSTDGVAWTISSQINRKDNTAVRFTSIIQTDLTVYGGVGNKAWLLAGSTNGGLYRIDPSGAITATSMADLSDLGNYDSASDMVNARIATLGGGGATQRLFVGTETAGLWSAYYDNNADGNLTKSPGLVWTHE